MKKTPVILGLVGILACSTATPFPAFAQNLANTSPLAQESIVRFGIDKKLYYEESQNPFHEATYQRTIDQKLGHAWGKYFIREEERGGGFEAWGVLENGVPFYYSERVSSPKLEVITNLRGITEKVVLGTFLLKDYARIGTDEIDLGQNFYESQGSTVAWEKLDEKGKIHCIFLTYKDWLNIIDLTKIAAKRKRVITPEELNQILDTLRPKK